MAGAPDGVLKLVERFEQNRQAYGLGHDHGVSEPQPVRECFGPRF